MLRKVKFQSLCRGTAIATADLNRTEWFGYDVVSIPLSRDSYCNRREVLRYLNPEVCFNPSVEGQLLQHLIQQPKSFQRCVCFNPSVEGQLLQRKRTHLL